MTRDDLLQAARDGKIVGVVFLKRDGKKRSLAGRLGVRKALKGGTKSYSDEEKGIVTVFDMWLELYRSIRVDSILKVTVKGRVIYQRDMTDDERRAQQLADGSSQRPDAGSPNSGRGRFRSKLERPSHTRLRNHDRDNRKDYEQRSFDFDSSVV